MSEEHATIARKSTFILTVKLFLTLSSSIVFFFVAKSMGSEAIGMIGFATSFVGLFLATDFGFDIAHNKKISEGNDIGECIGTYLKIKIFITLILVTILCCGLYIWENVLGHGYQDPMIRPIIWMFIIYYVLFSFAQVPIQTFGGLRQSAKQQMPEFVGTFARAPIMIYVAVASLGVIALAFSYVVTGLIMVLLAFYLLRNFKIKKSPSSLRKEYVRFAAPLVVYTFIWTACIHLDKFILQFFWDFHEVGVFFLMQKIVLVVIMISTSIMVIVFPSISYYHSRNARKHIRFLIQRVEKYLSMTITPVIVVFITVSGPLINIFGGNEFMDGTTTLKWLSVYVLFYSFSMPRASLILGYGRSDITAKIGLAIAFTNIGLLLILVPRSIYGFELLGLGSMGAALALTISFALGFFLIRKYSRKIIKIPKNRHVRKHLFSGILMGLILFYMTNNVWQIARWYELLVISGFGLMCYLGVLFLIGGFRKKELNFFLDLLNIRKMFSYIRRELKE